MRLGTDLENKPKLLHTKEEQEACLDSLVQKLGTQQCKSMLMFHTLLKFLLKGRSQSFQHTIIAITWHWPNSRRNLSFLWPSLLNYTNIIHIIKYNITNITLGITITWTYNWAWSTTQPHPPCSDLLPHLLHLSTQTTPPPPLSTSHQCACKAISSPSIISQFHSPSPQWGCQAQKRTALLIPFSVSVPRSLLQIASETHHSSLHCPCYLLPLD